MTSDSRAPRILAPRFVLGFALLSAACAVPTAITLRFDGSVNALLADSGIASVERRRATTAMRDAEIIVPCFEECDRAEIDRLSGSIAEIGGVDSVRIRTLGKRRERAPDTTSGAAIHVHLEQPYGALHTNRITTKIELLIGDTKTSNIHSLSGPAVAAMRLSQTLSQLVLSLSVAAFAIALTAAALALRSLAGVALTGLCLAVGFTWTIAGIALSGHPITVVTAGLIPLLPLIGVAFPLYYLSELQAHTNAPSDKDNAPGVALVRVRIPLGVLAAALVLGTLVHFASDFPALRTFALFATVGTLCIGVATLLVAPAGAATWLPITGSAHAADTALRHSRSIERLGAAVTHHGWPLAAAASALAIAAMVGVYRSDNRTDLDNLTHAVSDGTPRFMQVDQRTWSVDIDGGEPGAIARLDTVLAISDLQRLISEQDIVLATHSIIDFIADKPAPGNPPALPETQEELQDQLNQVPQGDRDAIAHVVNADFSRARILVQTDNIDSALFNALRERIEAVSRRTGWSRWLGRQTPFPRDIDITPSGAMVEFHRHGADLKTHVLYGLAATALALLLVVSIQFLSGSVGFAVVFLNLAAIIVAYGLTAWTGIATNPVTAPLSTLLLGIAVGHTAYYFRALGANGRTLDCPTEALAGVVQSAGRPLAYCAAALVVGFAVMLTSQIPGLRWFGMLGCAGIGLAFSANLLMLSSRILNARIITVAEFLTTRLGRIEELPLFEGMHPFQARLVVVSGYVRRAAPGEAIARQGEQGSELYLLMSGHAEVRKSEGRPVIGQIRRGDVIGEMGLVRAAPRSADVIATEAVEYLVLDGDFLDRLRRQYPRTASVLLFNLTRILSDRLDLATERLAAR